MSPVSIYATIFAFFSGGNVRVEMSKPSFWKGLAQVPYIPIHEFKHMYVFAYCTIRCTSYSLGL